jgi:hypothetical protein
MNKKRMIVSVWFWMLLGVVAVDSSFAQQKMPEISSLTAKGKRWMPEIPDFNRGGKKNDRHDWNLGPTGARGWMWGMRLRTDYARQILITKVDPGSPADGILQVDDVILGINGKKFDSEARIAFGKAVAEAEKAENRGLLKLIRWRKGKTENVTLQLKVMGTYGPMAPMNCPKSQRILENACRYIEENGIGRGITGHVNALGLLASGNKSYLPMVRDYAHKIRVKDAYSMSSWNMSYMNIFLSEYCLLTGDKAVLPKIREMALYLANGQSRVGTWGHGNAGPDGILGGYGAMCQPTLSCAVSLVLNQKCGIDEPVVEQAIRKAEIFFLHFVDRGNIPYGDHSPREVHDSNGRNSLAVIFFDLLDKYRFKEAIPYIADYVRTMKQHGSEDRIYRVMDALKSFGAAAKSALPELYKTRKYYQENLGPGKPLDFLRWALDKFMKGLNEGIKAIEEATETPKDLRTIADYLEKN